MHHHLKSALCITALALPATHAAESFTTPPLATDAAATVPASPYNSAFTGYQPFSEQKPALWHEVNDAVHKAGGHNGIFGGATGAPLAPAQRPAEQTK